MTNTLHRYGSRQSLADDWIVFALPARGINDRGCVPKLRAFLRAAAKYNPVNLRGSEEGGLFRPQKGLHPLRLYLTGRRHAVSLEEIINEVKEPGLVSAVFDQRDNLEAFLKELRTLDLGISVNISALTEEARESSLKAGIAPHSVEYSLGFRGQMDRLPSRQVLELSTMCGHGMVSCNFSKKMIEHVKEGRQSVERASQYMAKFCTCGVFNVARAKRLLEAARLSD